MPKTHLKIVGVDARSSGQTEFEYSHQTACGYVRDNVTRSQDKVDCLHCLRTEYHKSLNVKYLARACPKSKSALDAIKNLHPCCKNVRKPMCKST